MFGDVWYCCDSRMDIAVAEPDVVALREYHTSSCSSFLPRLHPSTVVKNTKRRARSGPLSFSQDMTAHITSLTYMQRPRIILLNYQTRQIHSLPTTHRNSRLTSRTTTSSSPAAKYHNHNLSSPLTDLRNTTSKKSLTHDD